MAHNSIIQLSTKPIPNNHYLSVYDMESINWFDPYDCDYTYSVSQEEKEYVVNFSFKDTQGIKFFSEKTEDGNGERLYFIIEDKTAYFKHDFNDFKKILNSMISNVDISEYISWKPYYKIESDLIALRSIYENKYGDYIAFEDDKDSYPINEFFRLAEEGIKYYIGDVVKYHW